MHNKIAGILTALIAVIAFGLFSTQSVAAESVPTTNVDICVNVQQGRQPSWEEEIRWELRPNPGGDEDFSTPNGENFALADNGVATQVCFLSQGVPGETYQLWVKGETSGHTQELVSLSFDCDGDAVLCLVNQIGAACHTGRKNCFYLKVDNKAHKVHIVSSK